MSEQVSSTFTYNIDAVDHSIRQTNALLRSINAIRHAVDDARDLAKRPTVGKFFWTAIQLMRVYTSLKRLLRIISLEVTEFDIGYIPPTPIPPPLTPLTDIRIHSEAFLNNMPIKLEQIDLRNLRDDTEKKMRSILEREAPVMVADARRLLNERMAAYESPWIVRPTSGLLESKIGWTPTVGGVRVVADTFYAWWVETGQRSFTGYHFMEDATNLSRERLFYAVQEQVDELILGSE